MMHLIPIIYDMSYIYIRPFREGKCLIWGMYGMRGEADSWSEVKEAVSYCSVSQSLSRSPEKSM